MAIRIKICGITRESDAQAAVDAGADALGLNFYAPSPRSVTPVRAADLAASVTDETTIVGVFVNADSSEIKAVCEQVSVDIVQLHGDEPPSLVHQLAPLPCIRAFRLRGEPADWQDGMSQIERFVAACQDGPGQLAGVLVDTQVAGHFGGTGVTLDWDRLAAMRSRFRQVPLILAGGLRPENVGQAIRVVRPDGVDAASGVESAPGIKDALLVERFVLEAHQALENRG